ncbi:hypothetical protein [Bradyrhizobium sp. S69]|uniref:hypothetical protein n=1 Tax=Bradyrhizobium sp. S69 TaxID=1641856 RepID=UPI00131E1ADE|nr:hypothetical protein [Bradyrhizobium sp. S69]
MSNFSFIKIDVPAAAGTYAYISADGVDAAGEAVGNYGNVDGEGDGTFDGFVTEGSSGITYNPPGSTNTDVVGITSSGEIFGDYVDNVLHQHGFVDNAGVVTKVDVFLANSTTVDGVNGSGVIYGEFADSSNHVHGFVDTNGSYTQIDVPGSSSTSVVGVNASGQIAGTSTDADGVGHGFVESGGGFTTIDPAGSIDTSIVGIDDAGVVVGNYQDSANNLHGFVDTNGVITTINISGATSTSIQAINAAGEIVGYYTDSGGNVHGFVDQGGVIASVDVPGATETDIIGVSASGEITGYFNDTSGDQHGFVGTPAPVVIESFGSTSLTQVGENYYFYANGTSTGPELSDGGSPVTAGEFSGWTPIGGEQISGGGYDVAWKNAATDVYTVWQTDSNGNIISTVASSVSGTSTTLESLETAFHQDLNGDGVIGIPTTVIEQAGSTSLTQVGENYYFYANGTSTGPELSVGGSPVVVGEFSGWTPIGAEQISGGGYDVALKNAATGAYTVWQTDSHGNVLAAVASSVSGTSTTLESLETVFHQDLNGDGVIGIPATVIEQAGSTSLTQVGENYYFYANGTSTGPELSVGGSPVTVGEFSGWTPIGAEQIAGGGYDVAMKNAATDAYTVWQTDSHGNVLTALASSVSGTSTTLESLETVFHQDLNGDGVIGIPAIVIEQAGSTSLTQVGENYYFYANGTSTGPELSVGGSPVVAGEFPGWTPIGGEQISGGGYDVALKNAATDAYTVWQTDGNGNVLTALASSVSGTSTTLESLETVFHQDFNGDGVIGIPTTVIEQAGSTSLTQVGENYYFYANGTSTGPELSVGGSPVTAGEFPGWTPIGGEQISGGGYDVAMKNAATDAYTVWQTDGNGNVLTALASSVSGTSATLESLETVFPPGPQRRWRNRHRLDRDRGDRQHRVDVEPHDSGGNDRCGGETRIDRR